MWEIGRELAAKLYLRFYPDAEAKPISIGSEGELTDEHFAAVKEFVEQLGGIENTRRAIAALKELVKAA